MTGKIIDNGPPIAIVLILPIAVVFAVLFVAWRVLLLLLALFIAWKVWDNYQWQKLSKKVNPVFSQLLKENRGCLTPIDLSLKANLSGRVARQFLERKSQEYGAQRQQIEDKGIAYLFLTASALGSIFDDSESDTESPTTSQLTSTSPAVAAQLPQSSASEIGQIVELEKSTAVAEKEVEIQDRSIASQHNYLQEKQQEEHLSSHEYSSLEYIDSVGTTEEERASEQKESVRDNQENEALSLIQAELADRLGVNSSTVGRQKSKSDFPEWSQSRDPEGIAWKYISETKIFVSLDAETESS